MILTVLYTTPQHSFITGGVYLWPTFFPSLPSSPGNHKLNLSLWVCLECRWPETPFVPVTQHSDLVLLSLSNWSAQTSLGVICLPTKIRLYYGLHSPCPPREVPVPGAAPSVFPPHTRLHPDFWSSFLCHLFAELFFTLVRITSRKRTGSSRRSWGWTRQMQW